MSYNSENLYTPKTFIELEQELLEQYNSNFGIGLTLEQFRYTNIYAVFLILLQHRLINENNLGLLFDKITSYLKTKQELEIIPKGATYVGLENALLQLKKADKQAQLITTVVLADNNNYPETCKVGEAYIVLEYETNETNNKLIGECLASNAPLATAWQGSITYNATSPVTKNTYTFKWELLKTTNIKIKLHYKYDKNYYGDRLQETDIKTNYFNSFTQNYKAGQDLLPAKINDISYYPSLAYVNTEISIDNGKTYLPLNQIILGTYNTKYNIANKETNIKLVLDN